MKVYGWILIMVMIWQQVNGQRGRNPQHIFSAGMVAGVSISQMDGDYFTGYDKAGFYGGLRGVVHFSQRSKLSVGLLYSQKGSKIQHGVLANSEVRDRVIELNYAEVPVLFKYHLSPGRLAPYGELGVSLARLLDTRIDEREPADIKGTIYQDIVTEFRGNDASVTIGLGYPITNKLEIGLRYSYSINKFYKHPDFALPDPFTTRVKEVEFLRNYHIVLMLSYQLLAN